MVGLYNTIKNKLIVGVTHDDISNMGYRDVDVDMLFAHTNEFSELFFKDLTGSLFDALKKKYCIGDNVVFNVSTTKFKEESDWLKIRFHSAILYELTGKTIDELNDAEISAMSEIVNDKLPVIVVTYEIIKKQVSENEMMWNIVNKVRNARQEFVDQNIAEQQTLVLQAQSEFIYNIENEIRKDTELRKNIELYNYKNNWYIATNKQECISKLREIRGIIIINDVTYRELVTTGIKLYV